MKKLLYVFLLLISLSVNLFSENYANSPDFSIGLGTSDSSAFFIECDYKTTGKKTWLIHGGITGTSKPSGKKVPEQLWNYGKTKTNSGSYFTTYDIGIQKILLERFMVLFGVSIGTKEYFERYQDRRFRGGHYYLITNKESLIAFDTALTFWMSNHSAFFIRYNPIIGGGVGIKIGF